MFNNLSIQNIAVGISLLCGLLMLSLGYYHIKSQNIDLDLTKSLISLLGALILFYFVVLFVLERYVFNKLRIIYKFIDKTKTGSLTNDSNDKDVTSIDKVKNDVIQWASDTEKRIESLQTLAEYRKNFVGNVSHELKTPIFSLQGYLHTLIDGGIYDEKINVKYIQKAAENADRLQHIVEDLESIGHIESGKLELDIEDFDIRQLIREVFLDQKRQAGKAEINLIFGNPSDIPLMVKGDTESIRQVLNNLITNSIKYGEKGGNIKISTFKVDKSILIEVSDDGIGIEEKHLEHLFDRFYRVDKSRSRSKGGSGLGLSIVKHIIEAHKQTITVRSTVGEGTTFGFTLPLV